MDKIPFKIKFFSPESKIPLVYISVLVFTFWASIVLIEFFIQAEFIVYETGGAFNFLTAHFAYNLLYIILIPFWLALLISFSKKKFVQYVFVVFLSLCTAAFYHIYIFLLLYHLRNDYTFDFFFFWYNRQDAFLTLFRSFPTAFVLLFFSLFFLFFIVWFLALRYVCFFLKRRGWYSIIITFVLFSFYFSFRGTYKNFSGEFINFLKETFPYEKSHYVREYNQYIMDTLPKEIKVKDTDLEPLGRHVFFLHLESVSSYLVNETVTPNVLTAAKRGVLFSNFYANSVQTLRSQESTLCGLPPSLSSTLINNFSESQLRQLDCLPKIFSQLGYKTFFFKDDRLSFARTDEFMKAIGFDQLHSEDIMRKDDPHSKWGFREDVFLQRVFEYLEPYKHQKTFVYIALSATNHHPFEVRDEKMLDQIPYPQPKSFTERLSNSTFVQDAYFGKIFQEFGVSYLQDSSFFAFSDNAWPIGLHPNNIYNERDSYDENFLTFLLFVPPQEGGLQYLINATNTDRISQMDIFPTILDAFQIGDGKWLFGKSFLDKISLNSSISQKIDRTIFLAQPYKKGDRGPYIIFVQYPQKTIFDISDNKVFIYNLDLDPMEASPKIESINEFYLKFISDAFRYQINL